MKTKNSKQGNENKIVLADFSPVDDKIWGLVPDSKKREFLVYASGIAEGLFRRQISQGIGHDGQKLTPVLPKSRPDNAKGAPWFRINRIQGLTNFYE